MNHFQTGYRRLLDALVSDLMALTREYVQAEVETALAKQKAAAPRVSPRLQRALERAEERRKLAAERRAAALAARPPRKQRRSVVASADNAGSSNTGSQAKKEALPPPLFVHKRSRDGSIQKLERAPDPVPLDSAAPPPPPA